LWPYPNEQPQYAGRLGRAEKNFFARTSKKVANVEDSELVEKYVKK